MTEYSYRIMDEGGEPGGSEYLNKYRATGVTRPNNDASTIAVNVKRFEGFDEEDVACTFRHELGHAQQLSNKAIDSNPKNYSAVQRFWLEVDAWDRTREGKLNKRDIEHVIDALATYRHHLKVPDEEWLKARRDILGWAEDRDHALSYEPLEVEDDDGPGCWVSIPLPEGFDPGEFGDPDEDGDGQPQPGEDGGDGGKSESEDGNEDEDGGGGVPDSDESNHDRDEWLLTNEGIEAAKSGDLTTQLASRGWSQSNLPPLTLALMKEV